MTFDDDILHAWVAKCDCIGNGYRACNERIGRY